MGNHNMEALVELAKSFSESPRVLRNGYEYIVHPLTDGVPSIGPSALKTVAEGMMAIGDFDCDVILAPESMGIPYGIVISQILNIPCSIARKKIYGLPNEIEVSTSTGYSQSRMSMNGIVEGLRVSIVDSVVSTGGTLNAIVEGLLDANVDVVSITTVFNKGFNGDEIHGVPLNSIFDVAMCGDSIVCRLTSKMQNVV